MKEKTKQLISLGIRLGITGLALAWVVRLVDLEAVGKVLRAADPVWLGITLLFYFAALTLCIFRWRLLVPQHPALTLGFLTRSFYVAAFFNTFLPTTIGGDVIRGYDLIKATGQWREPLASILLDRLMGVTTFLLFGLAAWFAYPPAQEDPFIRNSFIGFCAVTLLTFGLFGSRRLLQLMLRPFSKVGLGTLSSHAKQFQETLLAYRHRPRALGSAFTLSIGVQAVAIGMFYTAARALNLPIPLLFLILVVPIIITVSQLPISLNGWGIREIATIQFLARVHIGPSEATAVSLLCAVIPFLSAAIGAVLFLTKKKRKKPAAD